MSEQPEAPTDLNVPSIDVTFEFPGQEDEMVAVMNLGPEPEDSFVMDVKPEEDSEEEFLEKWANYAESNDLDFNNLTSEDEDDEVSEDES